jgi:transcriptional regulator with XRE-family HTH domain
MQDKINKYLKNIAKNTKKLREKAGLSQEVLAEKISLSREFINRVENEKEKFSLKSLIALALFFNIEPGELFK